MRAVEFLAIRRTWFDAEQGWLLEDENEYEKPSPSSIFARGVFADLRQLFPTQEASASLNNARRSMTNRETAKKGIAVLRSGRTRTFNPATVRDEFTCGGASRDGI